MESGTMKALRLNLDNPSLNNAEQDKKLTELKNYFIKYRGRHRLYGLQYFYVIIFNALHVMLDIIITHFILNRLSFTSTYRGGKSGWAHAPLGSATPEVL